MFTDTKFAGRIGEKFGKDEPIFTSEILALFPELSRSQVFKNIKSAMKYKLLGFYVRGVYYLPSVPGVCSITPQDVIAKRYLGWGGERYGIISGNRMQSDFGMDEGSGPATEIVSNNETTRGRLISINGCKYIIKKSRCEITSENVYAYTLVQFFDELDLGKAPTEKAASNIEKFIRMHNISRDQVDEISGHFTARPMRNLKTTGIIRKIG
ncbi:MAG: hypothetical protein LUE27_06020 [Clostridia bacterium]|nr:hypothetical protein [Clostridia bacterium]